MKPTCHFDSNKHNYKTLPLLSLSSFTNTSEFSLLSIFNLSCNSCTKWCAHPWTSSTISCASNWRIISPFETSQNENSFASNLHTCVHGISTCSSISVPSNEMLVQKPIHAWVDIKEGCMKKSIPHSTVFLWVSSSPH